MFAYADALAAHKRRHPADHVMSALVHAEIEGEKLTGEELRMFFFLLVIAGTDTTRSALPGGVLALAELPTPIAGCAATGRSSARRSRRCCAGIRPC